MTQNDHEHNAEAALALAHLRKTEQDVDMPDHGLLAAWIDGTIDEQDAPIVEAALASDAALRGFVAELRLQGGLDAEVVPDRTVQRLHAIRQPAPPLSFTGSNRAWWISSAAAIAIAVLGFWAGRLSMLESDTAGTEVLATATFDVFNDGPDDALDARFLGMEFEGGAQ